MKKIYLHLIAVILLLSSCAKVYTPALFHQDIAYMPKPTSFDKETSANYVSAGLNSYTSTSFNDLVVSGQLNFSRAHVINNFNIAYGTFAEFGSYQNGTGSPGATNYFTDKFFGAVGGRASANFFVHEGRADIRFLGVEAAYSHEFGDYVAFRKSIANQPNNYVDARTDLFSMGLTTEVIFHGQNNTDIQHGIRGFLGTTFGNNNINNTYYSNDKATERMFRNIYPKASYFIKVKDYFGTVEVGSAIMIRAGLVF
jgi:hypothetical protein